MAQIGYSLSISIAVHGSYNIIELVVCIVPVGFLTPLRLVYGVVPLFFLLMYHRLDLVEDEDFHVFF